MYFIYLAIEFLMISFLSLGITTLNNMASPPYIINIDKMDSEHEKGYRNNFPSPLKTHKNTTVPLQALELFLQFLSQRQNQEVRTMVDSKLTAGLDLIIEDLKGLKEQCSDSSLKSTNDSSQGENSCQCSCPPEAVPEKKKRASFYRPVNPPGNLPATSNDHDTRAPSRRCPSCSVDKCPQQSEDSSSQEMIRQGDKSPNPPSDESPSTGTERKDTIAQLIASQGKSLARVDKMLRMLFSPTMKQKRPLKQLSGGRVLQERSPSTTPSVKDCEMKESEHSKGDPEEEKTPLEEIESQLPSRKRQAGTSVEARRRQVCRSEREGKKGRVVVCYCQSDRRHLRCTELIKQYPCPNSCSTFEEWGVWIDRVESWIQRGYDLEDDSPQCDIEIREKSLMAYLYEAGSAPIKLAMKDAIRADRNETTKITSKKIQSMKAEVFFLHLKKEIRPDKRTEVDIELHLLRHYFPIGSHINSYKYCEVDDSLHILMELQPEIYDSQWYYKWHAENLHPDIMKEVDTILSSQTESTIGPPSCDAIYKATRLALRANKK